MEAEEKAFIVKIYLDKAKKKSNFLVIIISISLLTYIMPLLLGSFDFGLLFEISSLIFLLIARSNMTKYDEIRVKRDIIFTIIPVGLILIYDFILLCSYVTSGLDIVFLSYRYMMYEMLLILYIVGILAIYRDVAKANDPIKYKESTDWFYEKQDTKEGEKNDR